MRISGELLHQFLRETTDVERMGRNLASKEFSIPEFFPCGQELEDGRAYISQSGDIPPS